jgi:pyroglutamyl-peptidase
MPAFVGMTIGEFADMSGKLRILVTGFGPFPGAPYNPTQKLVARLLRLRRPALSDVELFGHIFPVTYTAVDRQLPVLLAKHRPEGLLMFGLAARTPYMRIETRARNAVTTIWPDAEHARARKGSITRERDAMMFGPHTAKLLRAADSTGIDARASRNAGSYLCNYLSWRAIEATAVRHDPEKWEPVFGKDHAQMRDGPRLAAFIHVPLLARDGTSARKGNGRRITLEELVDAGEAMLMEMVRLTRQASRGSASS